MKALKLETIQKSIAINSVQNETAAELALKASKIRELTLSMISYAKSGHVGGCFSAADLLTVLYYYKMKLDPNNVTLEDRSRFILSKGHSVPILYAILIDLGILEEKELFTLRKLGSRLQGHPVMNLTPGIDMTTGSLGMGLSAGVGMAMASKLNNSDFKVYVLLGDGELQEGQIWESVMSGSHFKLNNLIAIVDKNNLQAESPVKCTMNCGDVSAQFKAFNWNVIEIDGHDIRQIMYALDLADLSKTKPTVIIAETCKGKGVSFMENNPLFHAHPLSNHETVDAVTEIHQKLLLQCGEP